MLRSGYWAMWARRAVKEKSVCDWCQAEEQKINTIRRAKLCFSLISCYHRAKWQNPQSSSAITNMFYNAQQCPVDFLAAFHNTLSWYYFRSCAARGHLHNQGMCPHAGGHAEAGVQKQKVETQGWREAQWPAVFRWPTSDFAGGREGRSLINAWWRSLSTRRVVARSLSVAPVIWHSMAAVTTDMETEAGRLKKAHFGQMSHKNLFTCDQDCETKQTY